MRVAVFDANGELLWERQTEGGCQGLTSREYLNDGTQERIVNNLVRAVAHARGELSRQDADAMPDTARASAKVNNNIPMSLVWNDDVSR